MTEPSDERGQIVRNGKAPEWLRKLVHSLDDLVPIPGLDRGVGLDAILGFVAPGAGDAVSGVLAAIVLVHALRSGVPPVVLGRMVMNILTDTVVGSVPILGDAFDVFYRSNRRNFELLEKHADETHEPGAKDYAIVALGLTLAALLVAMPFVFGFWIVRLLRGE